MLNDKQNLFARRVRLTISLFVVCSLSPNNIALAQMIEAGEAQRSAIQMRSLRTSALDLALQTKSVTRRHGRLLGRTLIQVSFGESLESMGSGRVMTYLFSSDFERVSSCEEHITLRLVDGVWRLEAHHLHCPN